MNTMQQEFDAVVAHLFAQGKPAITLMPGGSEGCAYRGDGGSKCAVGCRIPDAAYSPKMENLTAGKLIDEFRAVLPPEIPAYVGMFCSLQAAHDAQGMRKDDGTYDFDKLTARLADIAAANGLTFTKPQ